MKAERVLLIGIIVLWLLLWATSCSSVKRVLSDPKKLDQVGREWEKANPCKPKIEYEFIEGATVEIPTLVFDSARFKFLSDSLKNALQLSDTTRGNFLLECNRAVSDAYQTGYDQAKYECSKIKIPVRVDTVIKKVEDTRRITLLTGDLKTLEGKYAQLREDVARERKRGNTAIYWLIGICSGIGFILLGWVWAKFKKPLKK